MLANLLKPPATFFAVVLDVGRRSNEDVDYRLLGGLTDPRLARSVAKSLNASIRKACRTQREFHERLEAQERLDPEQFEDNYQSLQKRLVRRIPNDYGAPITYEDVEHGAQVRVQQLRVLKLKRTGTK